VDGNREYSHNTKANTYEENGIAERVSVKQLQRLVHLLDGSDVSEIEVKCADTGMRLVLRKAKVHPQTGAGENQIPHALAVGAGIADSAIITKPIEKKHTVTASLVGIFHSWAKPKAPPLINVGDRVKVGQVVGTIQSLNVLNEVESLVAGRVVEIFVQEGQPVEYGQPLMAIDSSEES
jgi:acetyl-CoA carboxylase biotin carboxyl carrier protein